MVSDFGELLLRLAAAGLIGALLGSSAACHKAIGIAGIC